MAIDIYSTRTLLSTIKIMKPSNTFFCDTFFPNTETFVTETVDVDFKKGKRKMAPFVAPRIGGIVMDRQGFITKSYKPPRIAPERVITVDDINRRAMGENLYSTRTPEERARQLLADDLIELDDYITRREEWMCREVLLNGKITMIGEGYEQEVDYQFTNKEALAGTAKWTDPASDPIGDLKRWRLSVIQKTGKAPDIAVFASDVVNTFTNHEKVLKRLDNRRLESGLIAPSIQSPAITFIGKIAEVGMEIYSYDDWYLDDDDTEKSMVPDGHVIIGSRGMNRKIYGAVTQVEDQGFVTIEGTRIPKSWIDRDNDVRMLRISTRHLPVPNDVDSWYVGIVK